MVKFFRLGEQNAIGLESNRNLESNRVKHLKASKGRFDHSKFLGIKTEQNLVTKSASLLQALSCFKLFFVRWSEKQPKIIAQCRPVLN